MCFAHSQQTNFRWIQIQILLGCLLDFFSSQSNTFSKYDAEIARNSEKTRVQNNHFEQQRNAALVVDYVIVEECELREICADKSKHCRAKEAEVQIHLDC